MAASDLLALYENEGFSADTLRVIANRCDEIALVGYPAAVYVLMHAALDVADEWDGPVPTTRAEEIRQAVDEPFRELLAALAGRGSRPVDEAANTLAMALSVL